MKEELAIIGGGPAGAAAAAVLAKAGVRTTVYESLGRLAVKPCGRAVPATSDLPLPIPRSSIVQEVRKAVLYVDGVKTVEVELRGAGYIVDKEDLLEDWIISSGAELVRSSPFDPRRGLVRVGGHTVEVRKGLLAGGSAFYDSEKIYAVQAMLRSGPGADLEGIYIHFDTALLGYYWVFPYGDEVEVGVGGFADVNTLRGLLLRFIEARRDLTASGALNLQGAPIAVGGVRTGYVANLLKIGEAAGFVLPLTGEGIRPSAISGFVAARAMAQGEDPVRALQSAKITRSINVQRSILQAVKSMTPERRREFLTSMPPEVHEEVALGGFNVGRIAKALARRPDLLVKLLRYMNG
ncbi:MAG: FAD-dependent monooxygenase [Acidilobus sp.]